MTSSRLAPVDDWLDGALLSSQRLIATRGEVFAGCTDVSTEISSPGLLRRRLEHGSYRLTPAAAQAVALRPAGGGGGGITALMSAGRLVLVERRSERTIVASTIRRSRAATPVVAPAGATKALTSWIGFRVVHHATGAPIAGIRLSVRIPGGHEVECRTNAAGLARVEDIEPGVCDVWSVLKGARLRRTVAFVGMGAEEAVAPELMKSTRASSEAGAEWVAHVDEHRVQTGETLQSIAETYGWSWQEVAEFNWGTLVPDEINQHLHDDVGCTQKTRDGKNYRFSSEDEPGLIYVPRPWFQNALATERTHVIRVRVAAGFRLILENEDKLRIPDAEYEATLADGSVRKGRLGRSGVALLTDPPPGPVDVRYPDLDDVEAKSLAAAVRRALDDRQPLEIHRLFRYPDDTIRRAIQAYDRYFNDYHGAGLRNDLKREFFSDEEAELVFFGYMSGLDQPSEARPHAASEPSPAVAEEPVHA